MFLNQDHIIVTSAFIKNNNAPGMKNKFLLAIVLCCISLGSTSQNEHVIRGKHSSFDFISVTPLSENNSLFPIRLKYHRLDNAPFEIYIKEKNGKRKLTMVSNETNQIHYVSKSERWGMGFDNDFIVISRGKMISLFRWTGIDDSSKYSSVLVQINKCDSGKYQMSYFLLFDMNNNIFHEAREIKIDTCDLTTNKQWLREKAYASIEYTFQVKSGSITSANITDRKSVV